MRLRKIVQLEERKEKIKNEAITTMNRQTGIEITTGHNAQPGQGWTKGGELA